MEKMLDNDTNIKNLKKRAVLRYLMIALLVITLVLVVLYFVLGISIIFPLITYIIAFVLKTIRNNTPINKNDNLSDVEKEIKNASKRKK